MNSVVINSLPTCPQRMGRIYEKVPVMTCGFREIEPTECVKCGGFKNPIVIKK